MKYGLLICSVFVCVFSNMAHGADRTDFSNLRRERCSKDMWALYVQYLATIAKNRAVQDQLDVVKRERNLLQQRLNKLQQEYDAQHQEVVTLRDVAKKVVQLNNELEQMKRDYVNSIGDNRFTVTAVVQHMAPTPQHSPSLLPAPVSTPESTVSALALSPALRAAPAAASALPGLSLLPPPPPYQHPPAYVDSVGAASVVGDPWRYLQFMQ